MPLIQIIDFSRRVSNLNSFTLYLISVLRRPMADLDARFKISSQNIKVPSHAQNGNW